LAKERLGLERRIRKRQQVQRPMGLAGIGRHSTGAVDAGPPSPTG
jgi:hypothetical protein